MTKLNIGAAHIANVSGKTHILPVEGNLASGTSGSNGTGGGLAALVASEVG